MRLFPSAALCFVSLFAFAAGDLDVARQALKDGMWEVALSAADAAATNVAVRSSARLVSLEALAMMERDDEILRRLDTWHSENGEAFRYWRARAHARCGEVSAAFETLKEPFSDKTLSLPANVLRCGILKAQKKNAEALEILSAEDLKDATGIVAEDAALMKGELLLEAGRHAETRELLAPVAESANRKNVRLRAGYLLGFAEMAEPPTRTAGVARVRGLLRSAPGEKVSMDAAPVFAAMLLAQGDAAGADDEYRRCFEIRPAAVTDAGLLSGRGRALFLQGRYTEAAGFFARAEQFASGADGKSAAAYNRAEAQLADRHYAEAVESFARSASYGGKGAEKARFAQADALERSGDAAAAEPIYLELEKNGGEYAAKASLRLASIDVRRGRIGLAVERYDGLVSSNKLSGADLTEAHLGRGRACYKGYRFPEAAKDFRAVAKLAPGMADEMRFLEALCLYGEGMDVDAKSVAESLLGSTTNAAFRADLTFWCAKYEYNHGNYGQARTHFADFAAMSPDSPNASSALLWAARSSSAMMDYSKAVEFATKAANTTSTNKSFFAEILLVQGEALMELGRYAEAAQIFGRAAAQTPDGENAMKASILRADAFYAMGAGNTNCYEEAITAYGSIPDGENLPPDRKIEVAFKIGRALEKLRRTKEAMDQYYKNVVLAYSEGTAEGILFGEATRTFFARAAFLLADYCDSAGNRKAAVSVLERVAAAEVPASREARRRIAAITKKDGG